MPLFRCQCNKKGAFKTPQRKFLHEYTTLNNYQNLMFQSNIGKLQLMKKTFAF